MALIDHFQGLDNQNPSKQIPVHQFCAAIWLWMRGKGTRATLVNRMGLNDTVGNDKEQLDTLEGLFNGLTANQKSIFRHDLESALELYEVGWILNKTELSNVLGL